MDARRLIHVCDGSSRDDGAMIGVIFRNTTKRRLFNANQCNFLLHSIIRFKA